MNERNIGQEILDGIREIRAAKGGQAKLKIHQWPDPTPKAVRAQLNISPAAFAGLMGVSVRTVQAWEHGTQVPRGPARSLLRIVAQHPEFFVEQA
ncbi:MAG: helix-turn-helix domain-containing protein [Gammaproteobacteria bacterium]|nr:helix-turn-helix domain-containing protein [Gammaproteobacteria bacterium]